LVQSETRTGDRLVAPTSPIPHFEIRVARWKKSGCRLEKIMIGFFPIDGNEDKE
jgi:hypothetical protein